MPTTLATVVEGMTTGMVCEDKNMASVCDVMRDSTKNVRRFSHGLDAVNPGTTSLLEFCRICTESVQGNLKLQWKSGHALHQSVTNHIPSGTVPVFSQLSKINDEGNSVDS